MMGCGTSSAVPVVPMPSPSPSPPSVPGAIEVQATNAITFLPSHLTVTVGSTVRWVNSGGVPHTITSGASSQPSDQPGALFDKKLDGGDRFELTFNKVGDQPYFCRYHEGMGMTGLITVTAEPIDAGVNH
jgi:plastocyanin